MKKYIHIKKEDKTVIFVPFYLKQDKRKQEMKLNNNNNKS